jgi:1,4-dihydroxy-2-naphthoate octaprenyltransferase
MKKQAAAIISHLRIPFSFYLLPVYLFALSGLQSFDTGSALALFTILHLLVYPSSNGYNSYMDKDKGSIGGLKKPAIVPGAMFWITLFIDLLAIMLSVFLYNLIVPLLLLSYIVASRAYSYRGIRLKKYPLAGFLTVAFFQGPVVYIITFYSLNATIELNYSLLSSCTISFMLIAAGYPLTQIYQHRQDKEYAENISA